MSSLHVSCRYLGVLVLITHLDCSSHKKTSNPIKYAKLQTLFKGNNTTMRTHVSRMGMDHYDVYREKCIAAEIEMQERCMPQEEIDRLNEKFDSGKQCVHH